MSKKIMVAPALRKQHPALKKSYTSLSKNEHTLPCVKIVEKRGQYIRGKFCESPPLIDKSKIAANSWRYKPVCKSGTVNCTKESPEVKAWLLLGCEEPLTRGQCKTGLKLYKVLSKELSGLKGLNLL